MPSVSGEVPRNSTARWLVPALGYAISAGCLVWVYWGFDWKGELPKFAAIGWRWTALAVAAELATYFCQGWRWSLLLRPIAPPQFLRSVQSIFIGLFANSVLPFRSGEVIRAYVQALWLDIPFMLCFSSALIERLFDGLLLVGGFYVVTLLVPVPGYLRDAGLVLAILVGASSVLMGIVMFHKHHAHAAISKSRWAEGLWHVVEGLHAMGNSRWFYLSGAASVLYLVSQLIPIYALTRGSGLDLPLGALAVVLIILRLGTVLPQAPSNLGGFQFFTVLGLRLFGVDKATAASFATILFIVTTAPLWLGGAIATALAGTGIKDLHHHAHASLRRPQARS